MATIVHAVVGYFLLLIIVRVLARRAGAQMTQFEFVIIFLIGGVIIASTVGNDRSLVNCTCGVIAVGMMHRLMAWLKSKSPRIGAILDGTPLMVIRHGEWQAEVVEGMRLRREDVEAAGRAAKVPRVEEIEYAVLERNGRISVFPREKGQDG